MVMEVKLHLVILNTAVCRLFSVAIRFIKAGFLASRVVVSVCDGVIWLVWLCFTFVFGGSF